MEILEFSIKPLLGDGSLGGGEVILVFVVLLLLFGARRLPEIARGLSRGMDTGWKQFCADLIKDKEPGSVALDYAAGGEERWFEKEKMTVELFIAQGFGVGRIPFAPGTFGSLLGFVWFALLLLLANGNFPVFLFGCVAGVAISIWLCGAAEKTLKQKDPNSVVLDEIIAMPICFLGWLGVDFLQTGRLAPLAKIFRFENALLLAVGFLLFRIFDILKPWPVRQSQRLPGGWGVTIDDVLAAIYVNFVWLLIAALAKRG